MGVKSLDLQKASIIILFKPFLDPRNEQQVIERTQKGSQTNNVLKYKFYYPDETERAIKNKIDKRVLLEASTHTKSVEAIMPRHGSGILGSVVG